MSTRDRYAGELDEADGLGDGSRHAGASGPSGCALATGLSALLLDGVL